MECCKNGCPSAMFSHLQRGTLDLCQSDRRALGHLPDQGPSPPIAQFDLAASSRNSLGGSKLLPFKNDGGHCVLGILPQICASTHSCFGALRTSPPTSCFGSCYDMHCQLWDLILTGVYLSKSNLPQVDSIQVVETSQG